MTPKDSKVLIRAWDSFNIYTVLEELSPAENLLRQVIMAQLSINQLQCTHPQRPRIFYFNNRQMYGCPVCRAVLSRS